LHKLITLVQDIIAVKNMILWRTFI